jgi:hypothetical protein
MIGPKGPPPPPVADTKLPKEDVPPLFPDELFTAAPPEPIVTAYPAPLVTPTIASIKPPYPPGLPP